VTGAKFTNYVIVNVGFSHFIASAFLEHAEYFRALPDQGSAE